MLSQLKFGASQKNKVTLKAYCSIRKSLFVFERKSNNIIWKSFLLKEISKCSLFYTKLCRDYDRPEKNHSVKTY